MDTNIIVSHYFIRAFMSKVLANLLGAWRIRILQLRVFVITESNLGQCSFTLDDAFFPAAHGGKRFLDCVGEATVHGAKRPHAREVLFYALSLLSMGGEKNLEGMGEAAVHGAKSLHTREDNIMPVVNGWIP
ncbi:hypothetical protein SO802_025580 [Lithocarpus litseifolius]|uniref:Uncharacterized protein n=1 Tax=Lithocarpus litseifolius TaxID=425828 RepID=A0AAW2C0J9_9ROSI